jgi:hypothetical protein
VSGVGSMDNDSTIGEGAAAGLLPRFERRLMQHERARQ